MAKRRTYGSGTVFRRSDGRWIGRAEAGWTASGARRRVQVSAKTEAECKRKLRDELRRLHEDGPNTQGVRAGTTVKAWCEVWLTRHERTARPKYYATDASSVRRWIVPTIGHRRLDELTPGDVRAVDEACRKSGRSTTTARYAVGLLRRILKAAQVEGHRVPPRVLLVERSALAVNDRAEIPLADATALLREAGAIPGGSRWVAALLQGMRQAECRGLTWDCVDLEAGVIDVSWQLQALPYLDRKAGTFRVPDGYETRHLVNAFHLVRPKTAAGQRIVPMVPWMRTALTIWRDEQPFNPWGLVWPAQDVASNRPCSSERDRREWIALQDAARVAHVDGSQGRRYLLHEARHTTATLLLEGGVDTEVIRAILGHSTAVTTRGYQHVSTALARRALDDVAARLGLDKPTPALEA